MRQWGMKVYLDAGQHVALDGKPFYYCGLLNIYQIANMPRVDLKNPSTLPDTEERFAAARKQLLAEGGGLVSIIYHPCEFVHQEFWDGVNFRNGANPPREKWKLPPQKTPEETRAAFEVFENYVRYMKHFDDVRFITASDAVREYADAACERTWSTADVREIAAGVGDEPGFQRRGDYALSAAEVFAILAEFVAAPRSESQGTVIKYAGSPYGPSSAETPLEEPMTVDTDQFLRTIADVADSIRRLGRIPSAVWLGSRSVPPEAFLRSLAHVAQEISDGKPVPAMIEIKPARLASAKYVADDNPNLWKWVIFPPNFRAPNVMALAKRQAWTLKPAIRNDGAL
jgi:hypothetical protein